MDEIKWLLAFRYADMRRAGDAYRVCRDLVFDLDIDASAYRIQLNTVPHVVVIGDGELLPSLRQMVERACVYGVEAELPEDIVSALFERRTVGKIPGAFWERRSQ
ncbi:MAG: hypothetical protein WEB04_01985 [Dehalococcoidia bacterium]